MPRAEYEPIFEAAGREWNVDPRLLRAVAYQESGGNPTARSRAGAVGVMQIMPGTGQELGVTDLTDATQSIYGGAKYLSQMLDRYKHPELALAAYNAGPGRVDAFLKGGTLPDETLKYVPAVRGHYERLQPVADRRAAPAASVSIEDFLKETGAAPKGGPAFAQPAAKPAETTSSLVEDFLRETAAPENSPAPAPQDRRQQGDPDNPVMPQRFQRRADLGPRSSPAVETGTTVGSMADSARNIGAAAVQGFREGAQPLPPLVTPVMEGLGVFGPGGTNGTLMQGINRQIIAPVAQLGEWALRGANGLFRGAQAGVAQAGAEIDQPQLGRDLAAIPEAFMGGGVGMPRNRLAPGVQAEAPYARLAADLEARIAADRAPPALPPPAPGVPVPDFLPPGVRAPEAPPARPAAPPEFLPPGVAAEAGPRRSAGAAAATDREAKMSSRERAAARATAELEKLTEPHPAGPDYNQYIPGVIRTEAQIMQDPRIARNEKLLEAQASERFKEIARQNNETRMEYLKDTAGNPNVLERLKKERDAVLERDLPAVWRRAGSADVAPVVTKAQEILDSPAGRESAVEKSVANVMDRLIDKKTGQPYTDPQQLYGVRKHIRNLLEGKATDESAQAQLAKKQLIELRDTLDAAIEKAAPGFREYLAKYAEKSRPIDEMSYLIDASSDAMKNGKLTYSGVQRMLRNIVEDRNASYANPAQSITDETMLKLWALRDDLRSVASAEDLAKARGSDSVPLGLDLIRNVGGKGLAEGAGYLASGMPGGSLFLGAIRSAMDRSKLNRDIDRALNYGVDRLRPPPQ